MVKTCILVIQFLSSRRKLSGLPQRTKGPIPGFSRVFSRFFQGPNCCFPGFSRLFSRFFQVFKTKQSLVNYFVIPLNLAVNQQLNSYRMMFFCVQFKVLRDSLYANINGRLNCIVFLARTLVVENVCLTSCQLTQQNNFTWVLE